MKITLRGVRSIFFITALCMVFTMAFGMTGPDEAYAAVEEQVYEPFESAADILSGKDVPVSKSYQGLIQYNISSSL